jgi:hypothetical protein
LWQGLDTKTRLALNSLFSPGWPQRAPHFSASVSQVPGIQAHIIMPSKIFF